MLNWSSGLQAGTAFDLGDETTYPWSRYSSNSVRPYIPGPAARVDTAPQRSPDDPANLNMAAPPSSAKL